MPLFSIIIPVYNVEKYLRECVDSILCQKFKDYEVILVNDASPDNCGKICDEYANSNTRIKVIHHERNQGLSMARNSGIREAISKYLLFLDSDDFFIGENLTAIHEKLQENPDVDIVFLSACSFDDSKSNCILTPYRKLSENDFQYKSSAEIMAKILSSHLYNPSAWSKLIKRTLITQNNIFFKEGILGEDLPWTFELLLKIESCLVCETDHYAYRMRPGSISRSRASIHNNFRDLMTFISEWSEYCKDESNKNSRLYLGQLAYQYSIALGLFFFLSKKDRKYYASNTKSLHWLLEHSVENKAKRVQRVYNIFGFWVCALLLNMYIRLKDIA